MIGSRFLVRYTHDNEAVAVVPWRLRFPRVLSVHDCAEASAGTNVDTVQTYRRKGCEAWMAYRDMSWLSIAELVPYCEIPPPYPPSPPPSPPPPPPCLSWCNVRR